MKNITLSVDEKVLKAARIYAAEHDTTVSALVREHLVKLAQEKQAEIDLQARREQARRELAELSRNSPGQLGPDWKWDREALYDREAARAEAKSDKAARARERLLELSRSSTAEVGPITWKREDLYDR
jgi:antitoxin component of RelBE/YafQ-DinJ toxin-antitoxin module